MSQATDHRPSLCLFLLWPGGKVGRGGEGGREGGRYWPCREPWGGREGVAGRAVRREGGVAGRAVRREGGRREVLAVP